MLDVIINGDSAELVISEKAKQVLRDQAITADGPGTILRDFDALLAFIGEDGLNTTGKHYFLPQSKLDELNQRMSRPVTHRLKRPQQCSFPHLHGLYMLLRASALGVGTGTPPSGRLMLDKEILGAWRELNATERYFTLLESWLVQGSPEILAERCGWSSGCLDSLNRARQKLRVRKTTITDDRYGGGLVYGTMQLVTVALMELFGWLRLEYREPAPGEGVKVAVIERLAFGDAMADALNVYHLSDAWPAYHDDRPAEPGVLQPLFQPSFPEWQRTLSPPEQPFRDGTFTWRVSLRQAWRRIVAPADATLDDLAMTILDAFDFDSDHLYCFNLFDRHGRTLRIACPHEEDAAAFTDEVALGDLPLPEGGTMTFRFDYGDDWRFSVKLEEIGPQKSRRTRPKVTARAGRAPAQYAGEADESW